MAYIGNEPGVSSQRVVSTFTATAGQTTFTPISGYTLGYIDVYLNGIKLVDGDDYTAANGMTVVLASGAAVGDSVECVAFFPRGLSDGYLKSEADARYVGLTGDQTIAGVKTFSGSATIVNGNLGVGTSSVLGNSTFNAALGIAVRNQSTSMGYFQSYNANAGSNLKTWRWGGDSSGNLVFETVNDAYSSATNRVTLDPSGDLLVGATAPKNSGGYDSNRTFLTVQAKTGGVDRGAFLELVGTAGGSPNYWLGRLDFCSTGNPKAHAAIYAFTDSGGANSGALIFGTNASANSAEPIERGRFDSSGQFGIGVTPSSAMLHVKGNWVSGHSTVKAQTATAMSSGGVSGYGIYDSDGTRQMYISADSASFNWWGQAAKPIIFATTDTERARITASGQLLVQTTSDTSGMNGQAALALGAMGIRSFTAGYNVTFDTGIPINQGYNGGTALLIVSGHVSDGTSTHSALYLIQFYYNGNNTPTLYFISGWNGVTAGKSASNTLTLYSGTIPNYTIIMCT